LLKIERLQGGWLERIFLPGHRIPDPSLLRTHPKTQERIERLMALKSRLFALEKYKLSASGQNSLPSQGKPVVRPPRWHLNGLWH